MSIVHRRELLAYSAATCFIVDTCVLIDASRFDDLKNLLQELNKKGCALRTIAPAWVEFLRSARTLKERNEMRDFLVSLGICCMDDMQKKLFSVDGALFQLVLRKCKVNNPSYVDLLLLFVACLSEDVRLITSNYRDVPSEIFDVEEIIVQYNKSGIQKSTYVYMFNRANFEKLAGDVKI